MDEESGAGAGAWAKADVNGIATTPAISERRKNGVGIKELHRHESINCGSPDMMRPAVSRDGSKLSESDGWSVCLEPEATGRRTQNDRPGHPELQEEDDQEYRRHEQDRFGRGRRRREGVAGVLAAFHMLGCDIMLDPVSNDPKLRNQQQQRRQAE
jgi:hypothetical protein